MKVTCAIAKTAPGRERERPTLLPGAKRRNYLLLTFVYSWIYRFMYEIKRSMWESSAAGGDGASARIQSPARDVFDEPAMLTVTPPAAISMLSV